MSGLDEGTLIRRATACWLRWCRRTGHAEQQPSNGGSDYRYGVVTLRNGNGILAAYALGDGGRLRRLAVHIGRVPQGVPRAASDA